MVPWHQGWAFSRPPFSPEQSQKREQARQDLVHRLLCRRGLDHWPERRRDVAATTDSRCEAFDAMRAEDAVRHG